MSDRARHLVRLGVIVLLAGHTLGMNVIARADTPTTRAAKTAAPTERVGRFFPVAQGVDQNPYAKAALKRVVKILDKQVEIDVPDEVLRGMPKYTSLREFADEAQLLVWAYVVPDSPRANDPALLAEILKRMELASRAMQGGTYFARYKPTNDNHYNVFFYESFAYTYLALKTLKPDAIPADARARWERVIREGLTFQFESPEGHELNGEHGIIPNIDLRYIVLLETGAKLFNDPTLSAKASRLLDYVAKYELPDGAFQYYGGENESFSYQESCIRDLARLYTLTGDPRAAKMIVAARNYYPLVIEPGGVAEYATAPHWKAMWNGSGMLAGPEIVGHFADDPVNRGIAREQRRRNPELATVYLSDLIIAAGFVDAPDAPTAPQGDGRLVADANIGGFRGRFGRFSFLADARDRRKTLPALSATNDTRDFVGTHQGKATYVSALTVANDDRFQPIDAAVLRVHSAVTVDASKPFWRGSAYLSHNSSDSVSFTPEFGTLSARYELGSATYGPKFLPTTGWEGHEAWFFTKNRMVGYVEIEATADATVESISGRIALGFGRAGPGLKPKEITETSPGIYAYGDLRLRIVQHTYRDLRIDRAAPYFRDVAPTATELVLSESASTGKLAVTKGTKRSFVVEVWPAWSQSDDQIAVRDLPGGVVAMSVDAGRFMVFFNASPQPAVVDAPGLGTWLGLQPAAQDEDSATRPALTLAPSTHRVFRLAARPR
jgi:hypothetical protein